MSTSTKVPVSPMGTLSPTAEQLFPGVRLCPCGECGMPVYPSQYHPYAACLMFKACKSSRVVEENLEAVQQYGRNDPDRQPTP